MKRTNEFDETENAKREDEQREDEQRGNELREDEQREEEQREAGSSWILGEVMRVMLKVPPGPHSCTMLEQREDEQREDEQRALWVHMDPGRSDENDATSAYVGAELHTRGNIGPM